MISISQWYSIPFHPLICHTRWDITFFYSQILRYAVLCSQKCTFVTAIRKLYKTLADRGYKHNALIKKFRKALGNNPKLLLKYNISDSREIENSIFKR